MLNFAVARRVNTYSTTTYPSLEDRMTVSRIRTALVMLPVALIIAPVSTGVADAHPASDTTGTHAARKLPTIKISGFSFSVPRHVQPGARIKVVNRDSATHSVTADNGRFDVTVAANDRATFRAPKKHGRYPFFCKFHPEMTAKLVVRR